MKVLSIPITLLALILISGLASNALAQPGPAGGKNANAPEWLIWRTFHDSLEFYERESPQAIADLLKERLALTSTQASAFMSTGHDYLARLDAIDDEERANILSRYKEQLTPQAPPPTSAAMPNEMLRAGTSQPAQSLLPGTTRDGRNILELLEADGFIARVEARRRATLEMHLETLRRSFGNEALSKLEAWVAAEVAPSVAADTGAGVPLVAPADNDALQLR